MTAAFVPGSGERGDARRGVRMQGSTGWFGLRPRKSFAGGLSAASLATARNDAPPLAANHSIANNPGKSYGPRARGHMSAPLRPCSRANSPRTRSPDRERCDSRRLPIDSRPATLPSSLSAWTRMPSAVASSSRSAASSRGAWGVVLVSALLFSPYFLYRLERGQADVNTKWCRFDSHEMASRLSFLLW
jgi:hypothetical protein